MSPRITLFILGTFVVPLLGGVFLLPRADTAAQTLSGLHYTPEEVAIWKQRAQNGPFKKAGDFSSNSPGDWDRIAANASAFMQNPSGGRWSGYTGSGCIPKLSDEPSGRGKELRDAAFYALVMDSAAHRNAVKKELLTQVAVPGVNFGNTSKWCTDNSNWLGDTSPSFPSAEWATRILFAYDYVKSAFSAAEKQKMEQWFLNAANYFRIMTIDSLPGLYGDWDNSKLNNNGISKAQECGGSLGKTHIGGYDICRIGRNFNNRRMNMTRFFGLVGILLNNASLKMDAKLFVQETVKYYLYPDGTPVEWYRAHGGANSATGWSYAAVTLSGMTDIAAHFARVGDVHLLNYATSEGTRASKGGNKTLKLAVDHLFDTMDWTIKKYKWDGSTVDADLFDGVRRQKDQYFVYDVYFSQPNIFWQDNRIKMGYADIGPAHRSSGSKLAPTGPHHQWGSAGDVYSGVLFMFGQMEGKVWPFSGSGPTPLSCHRYTAPSLIPSPYGAPYSALSSAKEILLAATCESDKTTITVGNGNETGDPTNSYRGLTYVWSKAYYHTGSSWVERALSYAGKDTTPISGWCKGKATGALPTTAAWFVGYTCEWSGSTWNCGCTDSGCTQSFWQLQGVVR